MARWSFGFGLGFSLLSAHCGAEGSVSRQTAPNFVPNRETVSVFGVFKDGQMSADAWDGIEPKLAAALGSSRCEAGYSDGLSASHPPLSAAIEDYARSDGPTDDLLTRVAPAAQGGLILVVTFSGKLPPKSTEGAKEAPASLGGGPSGGSPGRARGGAPPRGSMGPVNTDELDLSASLFSVKRSETVAVVSLRYRGASVEEAVSELAAKLRETIPGSICTSWNWNAAVDPDGIRHAIDP